MRVAYIRYRSVAMDVLLSSLISIYFRFRQVGQFLGDVPVNGQYAANSSAPFFLFSRANRGRYRQRWGDEGTVAEIIEIER
jgi:hypothetical protein